MPNSLRLTKSMPPAAMVVAILALLVATAGVGYTAATIGTNDIQNDAVTSPKVKNGTLKQADLVRETKYRTPTLNNGTQNDCLWTDLESELDGLPEVGFRRDRFGTTHLSGIAAMDDGPGGDAQCGNAVSDTPEAIDDLTVFRLPKAARPASTVYRIVGDPSSAAILLVPGRGGLDLGPGVTLPWGNVMTLGSPPVTLFLDEVSFETQGARVTPRPSHATKVGPHLRHYFRQLLS